MSQIKVIDRPDKTRIAGMEHFDQNESNGNAATKYIIEFTGKVNCEWLWKVIEEALDKIQQQPINRQHTTNFVQIADMIQHVIDYEVELIDEHKNMLKTAVQQLRCMNI